MAATSRGQEARLDDEGLVARRLEEDPRSRGHRQEPRPGALRLLRSLCTRPVTRVTLAVAVHLHLVGDLHVHLPPDLSLPESRLLPPLLPSNNVIWEFVLQGATYIAALLVLLFGFHGY